MSLPNVAQGDPHVAAHNAERDLLNKIQNLTDTSFYSSLSMSLAGRRANTMVVAGDSLTNNGGGPGVQSSPGVPSTGRLAYRPGAAWTHALQLIGHRIRVVMNAGIGGETSTQVLARWSTDVLAYNAAIVHLLVGTNDAGVSSGSSAVPLATTKSNILAMIDQSQAQGSVVIVGTIPPRGFGGLGIRGAAARVHALSLNSWIRSVLPSIRPGVIVVDYFAVTADPASEDQWLAGPDGKSYALAESNSYTHWSGYGAWIGGKALASILDRLVQPLPRVTRVSNDPMNLITTDRVLFPGASSGVAPAGWTTSQAAMITGYEARTDGIPGNWLVVTVPNGGTFTMSRDISALVATNDTILASLEYKITGVESPATPSAANQFVSLALLVAPTFNAIADMSAVAGSDAPHGSQDRAGVMEIPPYTRLSGDTQVQYAIKIGGGGVYRFACPTVTKI